MSLAVVDLDTGEIIQKIRTRTYKTAKQQKLYVQKYAKVKKENEGKHFIWVLYEPSKEYFPAIKPQNIARLMFLVSYLGYEGFLVHNNYKAINKRGVCKKLNLSRRQCDSFLKEMSVNNILIEDNEKIYINSSYFYRGDIRDVQKYGKGITRLYINAIREIYATTSADSHKHLGYIFKVLPFANEQYNVLCKNPKEKDYAKIKPVSLEDMCNIIHYNPRQRYRLARKLCDGFYINDKPLIRFVTTKSNPNCEKILISSVLYHSGDKRGKTGFLGKRTENFSV